MGLIGKITGLFTTDTTQWTKGIKGAQQDVDGLDNKMKGFLKGLKGSFGKGSSLGQLTKLAVGGGAIAGLSFATRELDTFTQKLLDMQLNADKVDRSFDDYAVAIAKSLPIIGSVADAVENVMKLVTGQAKEEAEIKAIVDDQNAAMKRRNEIMKEGADTQKKLAEAMRKAHEERVINATPEGELRDKKRAQFETDDKLKALAKDFNGAGMRKEMADAQKQLDALKGKQDDLSLRKAAELTQDLVLLQHNYTQEYKTYQDARQEIAKSGAEKIQNIADDAAKKAREKQQEELEKSNKEFEQHQKSYEDFVAENLKHLADRGRQITEKANPLTAYVDKIKELDTLFAAKTIDRKTFDKSAKEALKGYDEAAGKHAEYHAAPTDLRRHSDVVTAAPKIANPLNELNKKAIEAAKKAQTANDYLKQIRDAAQGRVVVNF